ncbi:hypothetical protein GQX74_014541 [Glossina fuscipes]|nr:hypothetical protein GQX74_014541 [Glossina fuscipes]
MATRARPKSNSSKDVVLTPPAIKLTADDDVYAMYQMAKFSFDDAVRVCEAFYSHDYYYDYDDDCAHDCAGDCVCVDVDDDDYDYDDDAPESEVDTQTHSHNTQLPLSGDSRNNGGGYGGDDDDDDHHDDDGDGGNEYNTRIIMRMPHCHKVN